MNFIQPSIDPVIFSLSIIDIRWYSMSYIVGLILGIIVIKRLNKYKGSLISDNQIDNFLIWAVVGIILGGRFGYVFFYQTEYFLNNPIYIFEIWNGGMSFHGGLIGVILSIYIFCKKNNIMFNYLSDLVSVAAPIGLFLGRIANFINTELIGRPTEFYISVIYPSVDNLPRHPSQLYEAFFEGVILFIILIYFFIKRIENRNYGLISGLFLSLYGVFRFFIEFLREPDTQLGLFFNFISMGQILSIPLLVFGIFFIQFNGFKNTNKK
tara:strand:+ start:2471 stop:3271 length:801 start_codon:yes stop_codon:yes gene_type:complete